MNNVVYVLLIHVLLIYRYKLVITIGTQDHEEINCVLFNNIANQLLGYTVEELLTKSITEVG